MDNLLNFIRRCWRYQGRSSLGDVSPNTMAQISPKDYVHTVICLSQRSVVDYGGHYNISYNAGRHVGSQIKHPSLMIYICGVKELSELLSAHFPYTFLFHPNNLPRKIVEKTRAGLVDKSFGFHRHHYLKDGLRFVRKVV